MIDRKESAIEHAEEQDLILKCIEQLREIQDLIAELKVQEDKYKVAVKEAFSHTKTGQKSYDYNKYTVEIRNPLNYTFDKRKYSQFSDTIPEHLHFVKEIITLSLDKDEVRRIKEEGSSQDINILNEYVKEEAGKLNVTIKLRKN